MVSVSSRLRKVSVNRTRTRWKAGPLRKSSHHLVPSYSNYLTRFYHNMLRYACGYNPGDDPKDACKGEAVIRPLPKVHHFS
jgi:hypothetical protein